MRPLAWLDLAAVARQRTPALARPDLLFACQGYRLPPLQRLRRPSGIATGCDSGTTTKATLEWPFRALLTAFPRLPGG